MFETIQNIIADKLDIDKSTITLDSSFEALKIDSLDMVEIVCELEEQLGIRFGKDDQPTTVQELVNQVEALKQ